MRKLMREVDFRRLSLAVWKLGLGVNPLTKGMPYNGLWALKSQQTTVPLLQDVKPLRSLRQGDYPVDLYLPKSFSEVEWRTKSGSEKIHALRMDAEGTTWQVTYQGDGELKDAYFWSLACVVPEFDPHLAVVVRMQLASKALGHETQDLRQVYVRGWCDLIAFSVKPPLEILSTLPAEVQGLLAPENDMPANMLESGLLTLRESLRRKYPTRPLT